MIASSVLNPLTVGSAVDASGAALWLRDNLLVDSIPQSPARDEANEEALALDQREALAAQQGDKAALEALVRRHQPGVSRLLWRFVRQREDLEDLVQETFLRVVRNLSSWRAEKPFVHWLYRIAANTGRDYCRRQSVRRRWRVEPTAVSPEGDVQEFEAIDPTPNPAARAASEEVKDLLAKLSPDDCTVLTLHHLEGWDFATIAAQFGWTVTATKLRAWRARARLRALL